MNSVKFEGCICAFRYILYPRLPPLKDVLRAKKDDLRKLEGKDFSEEFIYVLRRCFAPVALGLDALHSPLHNKRW